MKALVRPLIRRLAETPRFISILQLNMLCHALQNDESAADFEQRRTLNLDHIASMQAMICVLEEVDTPELLESEMRSMGYDGLVCDHKLYGAFDYTCIFYKSASIRVTRPSETLRFSSPTGSNAAQFALLCEMQLVDSGHRWIFVATHAKAGRTEEMETLRIRHTRELLAYVEKFDAGEDLPLIWAGDMNASDAPHDGRYPCRWYPAVVRGRDVPLRLEHAGSEGAEMWRSPRRLVSAVADATGGREPAFTTCKLRHGQLLCHTIDYVLFDEGRFRCTAFLDDVPLDALAPGYLPHASWGSDHLSLYVELEPLFAAAASMTPMDPIASLPVSSQL